MFFITLIIALVIAYIAGYLFTEFFNPIIDKKPFNCRPCFSFWANVILDIALMLIFQAFTAFNILTCLVISFILFFYVKSLNNFTE